MPIYIARRLFKLSRSLATGSFYRKGLLLPSAAPSFHKPVTGQNNANAAAQQAQ
jgi:hypothetical protein